MNIRTPLLPLQADDGTVLHLKVLDIGPWNMDTVAPLSVAHGLTLSKILDISIIIYNDALDTYYQLEYTSSGGESSGGYKIDSTNIIITRIVGQAFDNADFNDTGMNRGKITILYTD